MTNHLGLYYKPEKMSNSHNHNFFFLANAVFLISFILECAICSYLLEKSSRLMNFRCCMNYLFVHSCKIKHIWDTFCLLFGFKEWNCAKNSTSAKAILTKGKLVDFRDYSLKLSAGKRNNEPIPVHIPEVIQACNSTLIFFSLLRGKGNSFHRLSVN